MNDIITVEQLKAALKEAEKISGEVIASDFFRRFGSTDHPLLIWRHDIEIPLAGWGVPHKGRGAAFRSVLRKLRRTYPQVTGAFCPGDGSIPDYYTIFLNNY